VVCYRLDDGLCVSGFMQKRMLLDAIQPSTGVSGTKKGACKDWKYCFRQLCVDSDRLYTDSYSIKMHVSGYQSIDMHCFVLPVKFDGRLAISVPRNEQLFTKN
jgi:hypothetical protein